MISLFFVFLNLRCSPSDAISLIVADIVHGINVECLRITVIEKELIVFDLDGTLVNTAPSIFAALNETRISHNLPVVEFDFVKLRVGRPAHYLFDDIPNESFVESTLIPFFRSYLIQIPLSQSDLYLGTLPLLRHLNSQGFSLSVATSKPTLLAERSLESTGILDQFKFVIGTDNGFHKPNPWVLLETHRKYGRFPKVMIGDRIEDAGAALAFGVPFVGVLQSTHTRDDFCPYSPMELFQSIEDLWKRTQMGSIFN